MILENPSVVVSHVYAIPLAESESSSPPQQCQLSRSSYHVEQADTSSSESVGFSHCLKNALVMDPQDHLCTAAAKVTCKGLLTATVGGCVMTGIGTVSILLAGKIVSALGLPAVLQGGLTTGLTIFNALTLREAVNGCVELKKMRTSSSEDIEAQKGDTNSQQANGLSPGSADEFSVEHER